MHLSQLNWWNSIQTFIILSDRLYLRAWGVSLLRFSTLRDPRSFLYANDLWGIPVNCTIVLHSHVSSWRLNTLRIANASASIWIRNTSLIKSHQSENENFVKIICGFWEFVKIQLLFIIMFSIIILPFPLYMYIPIPYSHTHSRQDHKLLRERCRNLDEKNMKLRVFLLDLNFICFSFKRFSCLRVVFVWK